MKKDKGVNELIDLLFSEELNRDQLVQLGFSIEDAENFLRMMRQESGSYMRILTREERDSLTMDAIIYLLSLLQSKAIDRDTFEHVIAVCLQIVYFTHRKLNKHRVDNVLNFIVFNEAKDVSIKEMIELFFMQEYEIDFNDEVH
jgi:uncharacterized protein Smg (DUF494 family)